MAATESKVAHSSPLTYDPVLDGNPPVTAALVAVDVVAECADFVATEEKKAKGLLYLIRIVSPRSGDMIPLYKIGYATVRGRGIGRKKDLHKDRQFSDRIRELNSEFDCCIGHNSANMIVVMVAEVVGKPEETCLHADMAEFRVKKTLGGRVRRELYQIRPRVYDRFLKFCQRLKFPLWESDDYVLGNDWGETWRDEVITEGRTPTDKSIDATQ